MSLRPTPTTDFPQAFTGRPLDADTGLSNYRARWYDPAVGRFVSEDPSGFAGGDANLYRYAGNSPVIYVDPSGLKAYPGVGRTRPSLGHYLDAMGDFLDQFDAEYAEYRRSGRIDDNGSMLTAAAKGIAFGAATMGNMANEFGLLFVDLHNGFAEIERNIWVDWGLLPESARFHLPNNGKLMQGIDDRYVAGDTWADIALAGQLDALKNGWNFGAWRAGETALHYVRTGDATPLQEAMMMLGIFTKMATTVRTDGVITPSAFRPVQMTPSPTIVRPSLPLSTVPVARPPVDPYTLQIEQFR